MTLKVEKHLDWKPSFPNEICITDRKQNGQEEFVVTLREGEDIEMSFSWDYGWDGRGSATMYVPVQMLKDLIAELEAP